MLNICIYFKEELRTFIIRVDSTILNDFEGTNFDYTALDSIDLTKKIRKDKKNPKSFDKLWYFIKDMSKVSKIIGVDRIIDF